ncbi:MAG: riboflavin biosynthesis protein RibF, partial [Muribaculaceae bacterium]|nr:riboflavin biosynthesis protein RibF [Muribaculaceae bacterium]
MKRYIATVGTFDGFHAGHGHLVDRLIAEARERGLASMIITFNEHPLTAVAPERVPALLASRAELRRRLESSGVASVIFLDFTPELMSLTAAGFMDMIHS